MSKQVKRDAGVSEYDPARNAGREANTQTAQTTAETTAAGGVLCSAETVRAGLGATVHNWSAQEVAQRWRTGRVHFRVVLGGRDRTPSAPAKESAAHGWGEIEEVD